MIRSSTCDLNLISRKRITGSLACALVLAGLAGSYCWIPSVSVEKAAPITAQPQPPIPAQPIQPVDLAGLSPAQQRVVRFISAEWDLGLTYTASVVRAVYASAQRHGLDPILLLAIAAKESSFRHIGNPDGGRDPLRPFGIMQVAGKYHPDKFQDGVRVTDLAENLDIGAQVVREYLDKERGNERRALLRYSGTLNAEGGYFNSVSRLRNKLRRAVEAPESEIS